MIKYPNGQKFIFTQKAHKKSAQDISFSSANRGISLEEDINLSNEYYLGAGALLITKRPTPIHVSKVDYSHGAKIVNAFFEKQSTTDYNGVYKSRYFDFEAKSTQLKTSFPLNNIYLHQINHLENVIAHGGIGFFIVEFSSLNEVFVIDAQTVIAAFHHGDRKSIPYAVFKENGVLVPLGFNPILDYLTAIKTLFNL